MQDLHYFKERYFWALYNTFIRAYCIVYNTFYPYICPVYITQAQNIAPLYKPIFWVREKANSNAEVDLLFQSDKYLIPVEIKSGGHGTLRSLHQFIEHSEHKYAIRLLANSFLVEKVKTPSGIPYLLMNMPYYASTKIAEYVKWFISNH